MMVTSSPLLLPTAKPARSVPSVPTVLSPQMKALVEGRLHHRAEKPVPNPKYPQLEERVSLLQTVGTQPLSFREVALSVLAASMFTASWGLANTVKCTYFNVDPKAKKLPADLSMHALVKVEMNDALGLNTPTWYYEAPIGFVGDARLTSYWKQWEEPASEGHNQQRYFRHEQTAPLNPISVGKTTVKAPPSQEKQGGLKQSYCFQDLSSEWHDVAGVQWEVQHARQIKEIHAKQTNRLGKSSHINSTVETNHFILELLSLHWQDDKNTTIKHELCIRNDKGITYKQFNAGSLVDSATKKLSIAEIKAGAFNTLLTEISYLPRTLKDLEKCVMIEQVQERNNLSEVMEADSRCTITLPVDNKLLTEAWWGLQEKNQPLVLDGGKTLLHRASHFLLPGLIGIVGAGLGLGVFHWWKEKNRNKKVAEALANAKTPETITYAQAKKYNLLG